MPLITIPSSEPDFHRIWKPPRKALRKDGTPQARYLFKMSKQRILKRADVDVTSINPMEFGHYESFRMITT